MIQHAFGYYLIRDGAFWLLVLLHVVIIFVLLMIRRKAEGLMVSTHSPNHDELFDKIEDLRKELVRIHALLSAMMAAIQRPKEEGGPR